MQHPKSLHKYYVACVVLFFATDLWSQEIPRKILKGKISGDTADLEGIYIINRQTEESAVSQRGGYFSILARDGDSLMFSSVQFKAKIIGIQAKDFDEDLLIVRLETMVHQLSEVRIIRYDNINAVALGILPQPAKKYTPAERRLRTAGDLKPKNFLSLLTGGMEADPIINAITGLTAMRKKEVEAEKKEFMISAIGDMYDERYFTDKLKIPVAYVKGFLYYLVENDRFVTILKSENKAMITFLMGEFAVKYNEIISREPE